MITAYNKFHERLFDLDLPVHIFGTSSKGNSVYLSKLHTLIDLGLPYKRYSEVNPDFFLDVDFLILTHIHSDHLNPATLKHILTSYPHIKVILTRNLAQDIMNTPRVNKSLTPELIAEYTNRFITAQSQKLKTRNDTEFDFTPHLVPHGDIVNIAIELYEPTNNHHVLYSSDIDTLDKITGREPIVGIPHPDMNHQFNIVFLEANYDSVQVAKALEINPNDVKAKGNLRHLSEQEAWQYIEKYMADDGIFIPLHASSMYGTLIQQLK